MRVCESVRVHVCVCVHVRTCVYMHMCCMFACVRVWGAQTSVTLARRTRGAHSAAAAEYAWFPPQSQLPELATLRPDGSVWLPSGYATSQQPWDVYKPGALLWETGLAHAAKGGLADADCEHGANSATGYCFLVDEATPMSYADRRKLLPLKDAAKPFDAETSAPHLLSAALTHAHPPPTPPPIESALRTHGPTWASNTL